MSRSIDNINNYIVSNLVTNFATIGITINPTLWSKRNMLRLICYTIAICHGLIEQLMDAFRQELEATVSKAAPASTLWVQDRMFKFQYSATNPQVISLIDTVPTYPIVDSMLAIITACSVTTDVSNSVVIKAAKGSPLVALSAQELASAQGYINTIGIAGINYGVQSLSPDKLFIDAQVFYAGQYAAVIQASVINALLLFLQSLSLTNFNGALKMTDLEGVIRNVTGVNDVVLNNVRGRQAADAYSAGVDLILNTSIIQRQWLTIAGYISQEDTAGKTFTDSLTFTAQ